MHLLLVWFPVLLLLSVPGTGAASAGLRLTGDERLQLLSVEDGGLGVYCVWFEQAQRETHEWRVELLTPERGLVLTGTGSQPFAIPFDLKVQPRPGTPFTRILPEQVMAQGPELASHCGQDGASFRLSIDPTIESSLVPGGLYRQRLQLRLVAHGFSPRIFEIRLVLRVPERIEAQVFGAIQLPDFNGRTAPSGYTHVCLFRNGGGDYAVRLQGEGEQGQYQLQGRDRTLAYQASWQAGGQPEEWLEAGVSSSRHRGSTFPDCQGGHNATVRVSIPVYEAEKVPSGHYQGRLRIIVQAR